MSSGSISRQRRCLHGKILPYRFTQTGITTPRRALAKLRERGINVEFGRPNRCGGLSAYLWPHCEPQRGSKGR